MATMQQKITSLAQGALGAHGLNLVGVQLVGNKKLTVQVLAERPDGTSPSLDECALASRTLATQMDVADFMNSPYVLEVGSPGLDRPLYTPADYERFKGRNAKVVFQKPQPNPPGKPRGSATGVIVGVQAEGISLKLADIAEPLPISFADIRDAHLEPSADELAALTKGLKGKTV